MSFGDDRLQLPERDGGRRYPGLDVMALARHWDPATTAAVAARLGIPPPMRFFTQDELVTVSALCDRLLDQNEDPRVPVANRIDARLAERQTDGWHYEDMPPDDEAWHATVAALDQDALQHHGSRFHELQPDEQNELLHRIQHTGSESWHGMPAAHVWSLWTRYACFAFYSHPWTWEEIGFTGPAYPRGYKNLGVNALEPFEVADARPETGFAGSSSAEARGLSDGTR